MGLSVKAKAQQEREQTAAEKIWEARRSHMKELAIDDQKRAILHEASRGHTSIAEAIWSCQRALKAFEA